jgi:nucleoid-associated protein YgaU
VLDVIADVEDIASRMTELTSIVEDPDVTEEDALSLRAGLEGVRGDARALLRELDATPEEDLLIVEDGAVLLALWQWRHETRHALVDVIGQTRDVQDLAQEFVGGQRRKVVVSRQGDTLQRIAARELGDWREWPRLLTANPSVGVGALPSGTSLIIPEKR